VWTSAEGIHVCFLVGFFFDHGATFEKHVWRRVIKKFAQTTRLREHANRNKHPKTSAKPTKNPNKPTKTHEPTR
jgi:hypothetical protein